MRHPAAASPLVRGKSKITGKAGVGGGADFRIGDVMAEAGDAQAGVRRPDPNPNEKLAKVFDSEDESEALVVKGLLESAGIDSDLRSASLLQDAFPGLGGVLILVREEDADAARHVIAEGRKSASAESAPDDDTTAEYAIIEDPPPKR
jgi:hypothetical protein